MCETRERAVLRALTSSSRGSAAWGSGTPSPFVGSGLVFCQQIDTGHRGKCSTNNRFIDKQQRGMR